MKISNFYVNGDLTTYDISLIQVKYKLENIKYYLICDITL